MNERFPRGVVRAHGFRDDGRWFAPIAIVSVLVALFAGGVPLAGAQALAGTDEATPSPTPDVLSPEECVKLCAGRDGGPPDKTGNCVKHQQITR